jgi:hypothetical protein
MSHGLSNTEQFGGEPLWLSGRVLRKINENKKIPGMIPSTGNLLLRKKNDWVALVILPSGIISAWEQRGHGIESVQGIGINKKDSKTIPPQPVNPPEAALDQPVNPQGIGINKKYL